MTNGDENLSGHLVVTIQRSWSVARALGFGSPRAGSEDALRQWLKREGVVLTDALQIRMEQGRACIEVPTVQRNTCESLLRAISQLRHAQVYVQHGNNSMSSLGHPTTAHGRIQESFAPAR